MAKPIIIDSHVHFHVDNEEYLLSRETYEIWEYGAKEDVPFSTYGGDLEDILKAIDAAGVSQAVVLNLLTVSGVREGAIAELPEGLDEAQKEEAIREIDVSMGERLKSSNSWCCDMVRKHPQLVPFIGTDPSLPSIEEAQNHIQQMVEQQGAKGIKLHQVLQHFYMHDERMLPICRTCVELGIPILAHSGPGRGTDQYAEPRAFAKVLRAFPELCLVLAHMGGVRGGRHWS